MTAIRWRDVDAALRWRLRQGTLLNGCGAKGHWLDPPDWLFTASCDHHDFNYLLGGTEADRAKADGQFYSAMLEDAAKAPWWKRAWYRAMAWTYYRAVRRWGAKFFHPAAEPRSREDLEALLRDAGV